MTDKQGLAAQDTFNRDPLITVFASSDAGTYGLNLQAARYVINYEIPMSYDDLMQRNSRIDRADSHLDGLTCYGYYCKDTVEERSFAVMEQRRELAEIIQGTREDLSRTRISIANLGGMSQRDEIDYLLGRSQ
jgi:SNF2 family DNA or RNA helicase